MTLFAAGDLRDRVQLLSRATTTGTRGESTASYTVADTRFARFAYLSGRELEQARKVYADATAEVKIRKPSAYTVTPQYRVRFGGVDYGVGAVIPSGDDFMDLKLLLYVIT